MKTFLEGIVKQMVDFPEEIKIEENWADKKSVTLIVKCNADDIGKLIGKKGKNANAIRTILTSVAAKKNIRCLFEVLE